MRGRDYKHAMKKLLHPILTALLLAGTAPAALAADNVVLVELFTSQGCSSCPPADEALGALAERDDVLALSLHVDYWDYLGWRDTFGSPAHTQRQKAYRDYMNARVIYTPQVVVQGEHDVLGSRPDLIDTAISRSAGATPPTSIAIREDGGMLKAALSVSTQPRPCTIWIASYDRAKTVAIQRGENAGRSITYHNVVQNLMRVGAWKGTSVQDIALPQPAPGTGVAIWVQDDATGRIITASFHNG